MGVRLSPARKDSLANIAIVLLFLLTLITSTTVGIEAYLHYVGPLFGPVDRPLPKGDLWPMLISMMATLALSLLLGYFVWILLARFFFARKRIEVWIRSGQIQVPVLRELFLRFLAALY